MGTCAGSGSSSRKQPSRKCKLKTKLTTRINEEKSDEISQKKNGKFKPKQPISRAQKKSVHKCGEQEYCKRKANCISPKPRKSHSSTTTTQSSNVKKCRSSNVENKSTRESFSANSKPRPDTEPKHVKTREHEAKPQRASQNENHTAQKSKSSEVPYWKNPPPLPADWDDWEPYLKEMWRNAFRDPREIQRELIREHQRLLAETHRRLNRERFMRQIPSNRIYQETREIPAEILKNLTKNIQNPFQPVFPGILPDLEATEPEKILGLRSSSTKKDAVTQYRRLCMVLHPDKNPVKGASDAMAKVNGAYVKLKELKNW